MRLSQTITELQRMKRAAGHGGGARPTSTQLALAPAPRANPGNLAAFAHVPADLPAGAPLLVVLHGCTQNAAGYDAAAGWSRLADQHGFALLLPEQSRANNPNLCFNWYEPGDAARGSGEAASIAALAEAMIEHHGLDRTRVFVTGLSAGGAMAGVMLATYPDLFAAGAIIAGLPFGCAADLRQAFDTMAGRIDPPAASLGEAVRAASGHGGPWPRVAVWHGSADRIVTPGNGDAIVRQWTDVHGLAAASPSRSDRLDGHRRHRWTDRQGRVLVEQIEVAGMAHGTPLKPGTGPGESGTAAPHMLDVGLSSTDHIAAFFGIAPEPAAAAEPARARPAATRPARPSVARPNPVRRPAVPERADGVQAIIEDALRSAGLMR